METTYLKIEQPFYESYVKIAEGKVIDFTEIGNTYSIDISEIDESETHNEKVAQYFANNDKCTIISKQEFDDEFIKTVEKINEISKL